jgi:hypothetical protein
MLHVPYRGEAPALGDLRNGRADFRHPALRLASPPAGRYERRRPRKKIALIQYVIQNAPSHATDGVTTRVTIDSGWPIGARCDQGSAPIDVGRPWMRLRPARALIGRLAPILDVLAKAAKVASTVALNS